MPCVLVIDDDVAVRDMLRAMLKSAGYAVACASDGREGLKLLDTVQPQLVITDLVMPEQEGLETIRAMRERNPDLPIIAISGGLPGQDVDFLPVAGHLGANFTLKKPLLRGELLIAVEQALNN